MKPMSMLLLTPVLVVAAGGGCQEHKSPGHTFFLPFDTERVEAAAAVIRAQLHSTIGGSKYTWHSVDAINVFKNDTGRTLDGQVQVAHYSWDVGPPAEECTMYLMPYGDGWVLLGATAEKGISHIGGTSEIEIIGY